MSDQEYTKILKEVRFLLLLVLVLLLLSILLGPLVDLVESKNDPKVIDGPTTSISYNEVEDLMAYHGAYIAKLTPKGWVFLNEYNTWYKLWNPNSSK
jgi:predicted membrane protein